MIGADQLDLLLQMTFAASNLFYFVLYPLVMLHSYGVRFLRDGVRGARIYCHAGGRSSSSSSFKFHSLQIGIHIPVVRYQVHFGQFWIHYGEVG